MEHEKELLKEKDTRFNRLRLSVIEGNVISAVKRETAEIEGNVISAVKRKSIEIKHVGADTIRKFAEKVCRDREQTMQLWKP